MKRQLREWLQPWSDWRRKRFWLLAAVVAWTLFGFFGAPPLVERSLNHGVEATGRTITIADVSTNPYVLSLGIDGLEIRDADSTPVVGFDQLYVNFQLSSLFRWAWTFDEIRLVGLHLQEERFTDGGTRLARLSEDMAGEPEAGAEPTEEEQTPRVIIHTLVLDDGSFGVTDQMAGGFNERFGPVSVSASDLRTLPHHAGDKAVSITTPEGGVISWRGDLHLVPPASSGQFTIEGKGLPAFLRYTSHFLPVSIEGEELDMSFDYSVEKQQGGLNMAVDNLRARTGPIHVRRDGAEGTFLDLASIEVTNASVRWPEQTANAEALVIDEVQLDTWLDETGAPNLLDAIPGQDEPDTDNPGWTVSLARLGLTGATVDFEDRSIGNPGSVRLEDLDITLSEVDNRDGTVIPAEISTGLASGGALGYTGTVVALPEFRVDGEAVVSDLALPAFQPWLSDLARLDLGAGTLDLQASVTGVPPASLTVEGSVSVNGLEVDDSVRNQRLAALEDLDVERFELDLEGPTLKTSPLTLKGAYGRVHIYEDLTTNLDGLAVAGDVAEAPGNPADPEEAPDESMQITIAGIEVEEGAMDFADDSLPLPFSTSIKSLDGNLSTLSTTSAEPSSVTLEGQVDEFGEARIEGTLNPWDFTAQADINLVFRNLSMSSLTPYTIQYAGYAIEGGRLDLDLGYVLDERQLEGQNSIVVRELVLGEKVETPDGTSLPLKLAVALLKDSEGVIDVDLPISGDLDDPTFRIGGIVWKAIGNLITKLVTSPFRFLGNLVGVDSEDFGKLSFQPGRPDVSPPDREQLMKLAEAMQTRPELSLVVTGVYSEAVDRPALQEQAFEARFEVQRAAMLESGEAEVIDGDRAALEALFSARFPETPLESVRSGFTSAPAAEEDGESAKEPVLDEPAYLAALRRRLIEEEKIGQAELEALGTARAEATIAVLKEASGESPIAASVSDEITALDDAQGPVELELEVSVREEQAQVE